MDTNKSKITGGTFMSIKKGTMPPRYDEAFKSGAIKMVTEQGRPSKEVAAELGICVETLKSWLRHAEDADRLSPFKDDKLKRPQFFKRKAYWVRPPHA